MSHDLIKLDQGIRNIQSHLSKEGSTKTVASTMVSTESLSELRAFARKVLGDTIGNEVFQKPLDPSSKFIPLNDALEEIELLKRIRTVCVNNLYALSKQGLILSAYEYLPRDWPLFPERRDAVEQLLRQIDRSSPLSLVEYVNFDFRTPCEPERFESARMFLEANHNTIRKIKIGPELPLDFALEALEKCHKLRHIDLSSYASIPLRLLKGIAAKCPQLQEIELDYCSITGPQLAIITQSCRQLTHLNLSHNCQSLTDQGIITFIQRGRCQNLTHLNLEACRSLTNTGISAMAQNCPNLTDLDLSADMIFTDKALKEIALHCRHLTQLNLEYNANISGVGVVAILRNCPNMTHLNLRGCRKVTTKALRDIALNSTNLRNLILDSNYCNVTNDVLFALAKNSPHLSFLSLQGRFSEVTDAGIIAITKGCPELTNLNLKWNNTITDTGFITIAENCKHLTHLNLSECTRITDASLEAIAEYCPNLEFLELSSCPNITNAGVLSIAKKCKKLSHFGLEKCEGVAREVRYGLHLDLGDQKALSKLFQEQLTIK